MPRPTTALLTLAALALAGERLTASRRHHRELARARRLAHTDEVTGLANRRALLAHLDRALLARPAPRRDRPGPAAAPATGLLLVDLDGFKSVNDTYGHRAGDRVLTVVGERLHALAGPGCLVARIGGDEFAISTDDNRPAHLAARVEQVRQALTRPVPVTDALVPVTASVGTATPTIGDTTADLLARADAAMYRAKKQRTHRDTSPDPCGPGPQPVSTGGSRSRPAR